MTGHSETTEMNGHCNLTGQINTCSSASGDILRHQASGYRWQYLNRWIVQTQTPYRVDVRKLAIEDMKSLAHALRLACTYNSLHELCRTLFWIGNRHDDVYTRWNFCGHNSASFSWWIMQPEPELLFFLVLKDKWLSDQLSWLPSGCVIR